MTTPNLTPVLPPAGRVSQCLICQTPLPLSPIRPDPSLCGRADCAWRYLLLSQQGKLCRACGRPLSASEQPAGACATLECQRAVSLPLIRQERERQEARQIALHQQAAQLRGQIMRNFGLAQPDSFPIAIVPACTVEITTLPAPRRRAFRACLVTLIARAYATPVIPAEPEAQEASPTPGRRDTEARKLLGHGCACCQGFCCQGGAHTQAYLEVETIQRYRAAHPRQGRRGVLAAYLRYIGRQTYTDSCVYHQANGCSLPRTMRAGICNRFFCSGLTEFAQQLPSSGPLRGFVVAADSEIRRAALLHHAQRLQTEVSAAEWDAI